MKRKISVFLSLLSIITIVLIFCRIDLTEEIGGILRKELKSISGLEFTFEKITLRIIPLRLDIENAKFEEEGRYLRVERIKIYPTFSRIINREIELRRIVLSKLDFNFDYEFLAKTVNNIVHFFEKPLDVPIIFVVNSFEIDNLNGKVIRGEDCVKLGSLYGRVFLLGKPSLNFISNLNVSIAHLYNVDVNLKTDLSVKNNQLILNELKIFDFNTLIKSQGKLEQEKFLGELFLSGRIFIGSLLRFFGVRGKDYGHVNVDGKVLLADSKVFTEKVFLDLDFDGLFYLEDLMKILKVREKLEGYTELFKGKVYGSLSNFQASAKAKCLDGNILGVRVKRLETDVTFKDRKLEFKSNEVILSTGKAEAYVWITLPVVKEHHVSVSLSNVSSREIFELIKWNPEIADGAVNGTLLSQGARFAPKGSFMYIKTGKTPSDLRGRIDSIKGEFSSDGDSYYFDSLEVIMPNTQLFASGKVELKSKTLDFSFRGKSKKIREILEPFSKAFDGEVAFSGNLYGKTENPEIGLEISSESVRVYLGEFHEIFKDETINLKNISGLLLYTKDKLKILRLQNDEQVTLTGEIKFAKAQRLFEFNEPYFSLSYSIRDVAIDNIKVSPLSEPIGLVLSVIGNVSGEGRIDGALTCRNMKIGRKLIFDSISSSFRVEDNSVYLTKTVIASEKDRIVIAGRINFDGTVDIAGNSDEINLKRFVESELRKIKIQNIQSVQLKKMRFHVKNKIKEPEILLKGNYEVTAKSNKNISGNLEGAYSKGNLKLNATLLKSAFLKIEAQPERELWKFSCEFNSTRIDPLLALIQNNLPEDFVLVIDGVVEGIMNQKLNANVNLKRLFMKLYGLGLNNKQQVNVNIRNNNIYFEPITLIGQATELTIKGKVVDYYDILIQGQTDLRLAKTLLGVDELRGRANILVYIYESIENPEVAGEIEIANSSITLRKDIPSINNLNAVVSFNEDRLIIEKAKGVFSEGLIELGGTVYIKDFSLEQFGISGNLSSVRLIFSPKSWAILDGELYLKGNRSESKLNGNVSLKKGGFFDRMDFAQLVAKSSTPRAFVPKDSWLGNMNLNVKLQADSFNVNNNLAELPLRAELLLRGTLSNPSLLGSISSESGSIYFRGNRFEITRFLIQFNNPETNKPYLNITARTVISHYNINLNINGLVDQFNLLLSSNPPLSENELLNVLLIGQNGGGKVAVSGLSEASSLLVSQLQSVIEERVRGIAGLDLMTIEPVISKETGTISPRITIGKKLLDGKLSVTYSTVAGTAAEQIIRVEYNIKKGVSLVGLRDEVGGLSGAIKFRFEFH